MKLIKRISIQEKPSELENAIRNVAEYPYSLRFANEFYEIGISLLKENRLYRPLISYKSGLMLNHTSTLDPHTYLLEFNRWTKKERCWAMNYYVDFNYDSLKGIISHCDEKIEIKVTRRTGKEFEHDVKKNPFAIFGYGNLFDYFKACLKMSPFLINVVHTDNN